MRTDNVMQVSVPIMSSVPQTTTVHSFPLNVHTVSECAPQNHQQTFPILGSSASGHVETPTPQICCHHHFQHGQMNSHSDLTLQSSEPQVHQRHHISPACNQSLTESSNYIPISHQQVHQQQNYPDHQNGEPHQYDACNLSQLICEVFNKTSNICGTDCSMTNNTQESTPPAHIYLPEQHVTLHQESLSAVQPVHQSMVGHCYTQDNCAINSNEHNHCHLGIAVPAHCNVSAVPCSSTMHTLSTEQHNSFVTTSSSMNHNGTHTIFSKPTNSHTDTVHPHCSGIHTYHHHAHTATIPMHHHCNINPITQPCANNDSVCLNQTHMISQIVSNLIRDTEHLQCNVGQDVLCGLSDKLDEEQKTSCHNHIIHAGKGGKEGHSAYNSGVKEIKIHGTSQGHSLSLKKLCSASPNKNISSSISSDYTVVPSSHCHIAANKQISKGKQLSIGSFTQNPVSPLLDECLACIDNEYYDFENTKNINLQQNAGNSSSAGGKGDECNRCNNSGCGITVMPGTHEELQSCCVSIVPKKRQTHFKTKHGRIRVGKHIDIL